MDGHHKLIRWGFVIHGIIDGYCQTVCISACVCLYITNLLLQVVALQASTNNTSSAVLALFLEAIEKYGLPSRVRGDRGGENTQVSVYMIIARGLHRASFIWGTYVNFHISVHPLLIMIQFNTKQSD